LSAGRLAPPFVSAEAPSGNAAAAPSKLLCKNPRRLD
jgi:hypothetical protein